MTQIGSKKRVYPNPGMVRLSRPGPSATVMVELVEYTQEKGKDKAVVIYQEGPLKGVKSKVDKRLVF